MRSVLLVLMFALAVAPHSGHAQEIRRMFAADAAEFRDDHNRSWIEIDLDAAGGDFGAFGLYVFPSPYELAVGYFGRAAPVAEADGSYRFDEHVPVLIRRPTGEILPAGQDVPMITESGAVRLSGTLDVSRHVAVLRAEIDGREVLLESTEPDVAIAPRTANAAVAAYVGEDWPTLYHLYTSGLRSQVTQAEFERQMRDATPPGPPVRLLAAQVTDAALRTLAGFVHYTELGTADLLQPSGRVTPVRVVVDVVWETGQWRLFHINIERQEPAPGGGGPAA